MYLYNKDFIHQNRDAKIIALACLLFGALFYGFGNSRLFPMPLIFQLVGVLLIVWSVYIATRFLLRQYRVAIVKREDIDGEDDAQYDIIVYEKKGKREPKVCHIGLDSIESVMVVSRESAKTGKKENSDGFRFIYDTRFTYKERIEIVANTGDYRSVIYLAYDKELMDALLRNI